MGKVHLCKQNSGKLETWFVLEESVDYIGAMHDGKVSISYTKDVMQADSITELLHKLQSDKESEWEWYVVMSAIDSQHRTREEKYPHHRELHILSGYIPAVCDFMLESGYTYDWEVRYLSELWVAPNSYLMIKVSGFAEAMMRARDKYIENKELKFEEVTK